MKLVNRDKKFNIWFRAIIFLATCFFTYGMSMYYMLFQHNILMSLLLVLVFFVFIHFAYLHFMWLKNRHLILILLLLMSLNLLIFWYQWVFMTLFNITFHIWIFMLVRYIDGSSNNVIEFDSWSYFTSSGYIFTVFVTIAWSFALLWLYQNFPFTCQQMSDISTKVIDVVSSPLRLPFNKANEIKTETKNFFSLSMWDIFLNSKTLDQNGRKQTRVTWNFVDKIIVYKRKLIDQPMKDNDNLNMWLCDYMLAKIKSVYQNTTFQVSIIIMLFLLLYWFIRVTFWVMTILWFLFFKILYLFRVYKFDKVIVEADRVL